jgi:hypothetical protein
MKYNRSNMNSNASGSAATNAGDLARTNKHDYSNKPHQKSCRIDEMAIEIVS